MPAECHLVIENLCCIEIDDTEQVQWYDINRIEIADDESYAKLIGNIPITVVFTSDSRLRIRLED
ncbi:MAG: hypothetical protein ACIAQF_12850 [Phycisphaerales bacterium JB065]